MEYFENIFSTKERRVQGQADLCRRGSSLSNQLQRGLSGHAGDSEGGKEGGEGALREGGEGDGGGGGGNSGVGCMSQRGGAAHGGVHDLGDGGKQAPEGRVHGQQTGGRADDGGHYNGKNGGAAAEPRGALPSRAEGEH